MPPPKQKPITAELRRRARAAGARRAPARRSAIIRSAGALPRAAVASPSDGEARRAALLGEQVDGQRGVPIRREPRRDRADVRCQAAVLVDKTVLAVEGDLLSDVLLECHRGTLRRATLLHGSGCRRQRGGGDRCGRLRRRARRARGARSRLPGASLCAQRRRRRTRRLPEGHEPVRLRPAHAARRGPRRTGLLRRHLPRLRCRRTRLPRQHVRRRRVRAPDLRPRHRQRRIVGIGAPSRGDLEHSRRSSPRPTSPSSPAVRSSTRTASPTSRTRSARPSAGRATRWARSIAQHAFSDAAAASGRWDAITVCPSDNVGPILSPHHKDGGPWQHLIERMVEGRCEIFQGTGPYRPWMTVDVRDDAACHIGLLESDKVANGERYLAMSTETRTLRGHLRIDRPPAARAAPRPRTHRRPVARPLEGAGGRVPLDLGRAAAAQRPHPGSRADHVPAARRLDPRLRRVTARGRSRRPQPARRLSLGLSPDVSGRRRPPLAVRQRSPATAPRGRMPSSARQP